MHDNRLESAKRFVKEHLDNQRCLTVKSKRTGEKFIIAQQYPAYDGWFVYQGCDLIIGDIPFDYAVSVLLDVTE